jgi:hypothetical protein
MHFLYHACQEVFFNGLLDYMSSATDPDKEIESFTGHKWDLPEWPTLMEEIQARQRRPFLHFTSPCYAYLVYLRQHGFPSPLLDWTASPYIAAFFAYAERPLSDLVAVYVFIEHGGMRTYAGGPQITIQGPYVTTHSRHFAQKAQYTTATKLVDQCETFCAHEDVFVTRSGGPDVLLKITMPAQDRRKALRDLDDHNINPFTLFQTEEALVRTMAIRQFVFDEQ